MRITFVGFGDFHRYAGMKQLYHFAQQVCEQGHQAQILIAGNADTADSLEESPKAEIIEMAFNGPWLARHVRQRVIDFKPDIIHVWTPRHVPALAGWQLQRWTKAPLVLDHEDDEEYLLEVYVRSQGQRLPDSVGLILHPLARLRGDVLPWLAPLRRDGSVRRMAQDRLATTLLRSRVSAHTVISPALQAHIRCTWPGKPVHLLYPGADLKMFNPQVSGESIRQHYGLDDRPLLVYSGTMDLRVFKFFVEVVEWIVDSQPDVFLLLVGYDQFRHEADLLVKGRGFQNHIHLTGIVPYAKVPKYLGAADILIQHPLNIGNSLRLPAKLPEYLAMGKPLITYSQGIGNILEHGTHALKLDTSEPKEMAHHVVTLLGNQALASRMGRAARDLAAKLFDWNANSMRLVSIYNKLI
jgi:glycosyltransferase involved in cell wall biosynthesis